MRKHKIFSLIENKGDIVLIHNIENLRQRIDEDGLTAGDHKNTILPHKKA